MCSKSCGRVAALLLLQTPLSLAAFLLKSPTQQTGPYYILNPADYARQLGEDATWATGSDGGIPLFDASDEMLRDVYLFRWRTYKSHIHPTNRSDDIPLVVTEFSPNVGWAGEYNTINCAAGHHMIEAGWLRNRTTADSYSRWWVSPTARHNYYYWYATALKRNFDKTGDLGLLRDVVPLYKTQFLQYAAGVLPHNTAFSEENDCLWNAPGNEGQEQSLSGAGCRTLIQSLMYGESNALAALCSAIGDTEGATQMATAAEQWQKRVLRLWNPSISSFDTLRLPHPPSPSPPPAPPPPGWKLDVGHNGTFCCDQSNCIDGHSSFLFEGSLPQADCFDKCMANPKCEFVTVTAKNWCMNAQYCNTTNPFAGEPASDVHTYERPQKPCNRAWGTASFAGVRELASLSSPWYFGAVPKGNASSYASSWLTAFDPNGLGGDFGLRTAEKRASGYSCSYGCCKWSGSMWPFETSKAITAAINVLNDYPAVKTINSSGFYKLLYQYTQAHTSTWYVMNGSTSHYANLSTSNVAQYLMPGLGDLWIAESGCADKVLSQGQSGPAWTDSAGEGYRYNHATFMDLILSGVVGIRPGSGNKSMLVNPLVSSTSLKWWAADGIPMNGHIVSVVFDSDGMHYHNGTGLKVWVDGILKASSPTLTQLIVTF